MWFVCSVCFEVECRRRRREGKGHRRRRQWKEVSMVGSNSWAITCSPQAAHSGSARTTAEWTDASSNRRRLEEPMHAIMRQQRRTRLQVGLLRCCVL